MKRIVLVMVVIAFALTGCAGMEENKETVSNLTEIAVSINSSQAPNTKPESRTTEDVNTEINKANTEAPVETKAPIDTPSATLDNKTTEDVNTEINKVNTEAPVETKAPIDTPSTTSDNKTTEEANIETQIETTVPANAPQTWITEEEGETTDNMAGIFDELNKLEYQPYTCDGLPEYKLFATDGTVYYINCSEKWVWRGKTEQAELSDELISQLKKSGRLMVGDKPLETP